MLTSTELKQWRTAMRWSQKDAAAWYGCTPRHWRGMENGERTITGRLQRRIEEMGQLQRYRESRGHGGPHE